MHREKERLADSLKNLLRSPNLTERQELEIYSGLTGIYASYALDSVIFYAPKAVRLAQKFKEKRIEMGKYWDWGVALGFRNNCDSAVALLNKARKIAVELDDEAAEAAAITLTAFVFILDGKYHTAIDYYLKVLPGYEARGNYSGLASVLANLSELYRRLNNTEMAIKYLDMAAEAGEKNTADPGAYAWRMGNILNEYTSLYLARGELDKALEYAIRSSEIGGSVINKCTNKALMARIYLQSNDYGRALQYAEEAIEQADILKDKMLYVKTRMVLSDIYLATERYREAEMEALKAWQSDSSNMDEARAMAINLVLANIYLHNNAKADYFMKKYTEIIKQYSATSFQTTVSDMAVKYETEKKERRISDLKRQNILYVSGSLIGMLIAVIIWIILSQKVKNERREKQLVAANAVLDWEKKERKRFASDLHDGINGMLSAMKLELTTGNHLQKISNQLDECIETIRRMARGMMPSALERYGMKAALEDYCCLFPNVYFHFFGENKRMSEKLELTVYYCAHELVNNSTKHSGAKNINVQLVQDDGSISLTVQDDGCGFEEQSVKEGSGLKNIRNRIAAFNGTIDVAASPGKGSEINIELKINHQK
jgi:signal transduction histidine kinase